MMIISTFFLILLLSGKTCGFQIMTMGQDHDSLLSCWVAKQDQTIKHNNHWKENIHQPTSHPTDANQNTINNNNSQLRLCVVVEPSPMTYVCGYANRYKELFKSLQRNQVNTEIITVEVVVDEKPSQSFGFPVRYTRGVPLVLYKKMSVSVDWTLKIIRSILAFRPNLIHASSPGFMAPMALFCARMFEIPIVLSYHTHLPAYLQWYLPRPLSKILTPAIWLWLRWTHSMADLTLVTSPQIRDEFHQHGIPKTDVWQKGVDTNRFHPRYFHDPMRAKMMTGGDSHRLLLLYVGRLAPEKQIHKLKTAVTQIPNTTLCIVGTGPEEESLKQEFANTCTTFLGELHGDELSQAYSSADVFVFPSDSETLGFVAMEAMASGLPVVAANAGGIPSLIEHGKTGYLVDVNNDNDHVEYARYIQELQDHPDRRREMALLARNTAEAWSWEASMSVLRNAQYTKAQANYKRRWALRLRRCMINFWNELISGFTQWPYVC